MKATFLLLVVLTLIWKASPTTGVFYRVKEDVNGVWVKQIDVPSLEITFYPKKGSHTYAVVAVAPGGVESQRSNSVKVKIRP